MYKTFLGVNSIMVPTGKYSVNYKSIMSSRWNNRTRTIHRKVKSIDCHLLTNIFVHPIQLVWYIHKFDIQLIKFILGTNEPG
jgi:hypothetical protein